MSWRGDAEARMWVDVGAMLLMAIFCHRLGLSWLPEALIVAIVATTLHYEHSPTTQLRNFIPQIRTSWIQTLGRNELHALHTPPASSVTLLQRISRRIITAGRLDITSTTSPLPTQPQCHPTSPTQILISIMYRGQKRTETSPPLQPHP